MSIEGIIFASLFAASLIVTAIDLFVHRRLLHRVRELLDGYGDRPRDIVLLRAQGYSYAEIAAPHGHDANHLVF